MISQMANLIPQALEGTREEAPGSLAKLGCRWEEGVSFLRTSQPGPEATLVAARRRLGHQSTLAQVRMVSQATCRSPRGQAVIWWHAPGCPPPAPARYT